VSREGYPERDAFRSSASFSIVRPAFSVCWSSGLVFCHASVSRIVVSRLRNLRPFFSARGRAY
jgi:hypothetical protein